MTNIAHNANEFRHTIGAFCQSLRSESDAILQTCAAFEKLQGYLAVIANQSTPVTLAQADKQRHTVEMAMLRTVVTLDEIFVAHDAATHAYQVLDPVASAFFSNFFGDDHTTPAHNDDLDD